LPSSWQSELQLPVAQTLALFVKVIRKLTKALQELLKDDVARTLPSEDAAAAAAARILPTPNPNLNGSGVATQLSNKAAIAKELEAEGDEVLKQLRDQQREVIDSLDLKQ
jgi:N-acetyltransferase 10